MLQKFLEENREEILTLAEQKVLTLAGSLSSSQELREALPFFLDHLVCYLNSGEFEPSTDEIAEAAVVHGKELLRLKYTLSQVVQSYGAMCQAITGAAESHHADISARGFNQLNLCLDVAIAAAVSEFEFRSVQASEKREVEHLGSLAHELRNALSSATIASEMISQGLVGTGGSTAKILQINLQRMRDLIDRSLSEVRMRADSQLHAECFQLTSLIDQVLYTAQSEARNKKQILVNEIKADISIETDRQLLLSVVANLTQNALKYSKVGGTITWRSLRKAGESDDLVLEIQDECGGLAAGIEKTLFKPFSSAGVDQSGLGLGLTIAERAVNLLHGKISVRNIPGKGCAFRVSVPLKLKSS